MNRDTVTQESAPMPERDVSPATEAGRSFNGACGYDHTKRILAIEQEAAVMAIERALDIVMSEPAWPRPGAIRRRVVADKLRAAIRWQQRIDSMSNDEFEAFGRVLDSAAAEKVRRATRLLSVMKGIANDQSITSLSNAREVASRAILDELSPPSSDRGAP